MTFGTLTHPTDPFFEGNVAVVEYLMKSGAGACVHMQDRNHDTPLLSAIKACHREVVRSLVACGAHLQIGNIEFMSSYIYFIE